MIRWFGPLKVIKLHRWLGAVVVLSVKIRQSLMTTLPIHRPEWSKRTEYLETFKLHAAQCECSNPGHSSAAHVKSGTPIVVVNEDVRIGTRMRRAINQKTLILSLMRSHQRHSRRVLLLVETGL